MPSRLDTQDSCSGFSPAASLTTCLSNRIMRLIPTVARCMANLTTEYTDRHILLHESSHNWREIFYKWSLRARSLGLQGWGLIDLPLRASNEGLLRPRVARAQKIIRLHPLHRGVP
jgi:hypothetical protein